MDISNLINMDAIFPQLKVSSKKQIKIASFFIIINPIQLVTGKAKNL